MDHQTQSNPASVAPIVITKESQPELLLKKTDQIKPEQPAGNPLLEEEMVIEEVCIDGMCGVY